jgi:polyphosphate glucokinase
MRGAVFFSTANAVPCPLPAAYNSILMTAKKMKKTEIAQKQSPGPVTLSIDIGGSGLKAMLLDAKGEPASERQRVPTPALPTPLAVLKGLDKLVALLPGFDRVSVGFPGVIKHGFTYTAVNLHPRWMGFDLAGQLKKRWGKPARAANDADIAGGAAVKGEGVELVLTLGTGMGSALFTDGKLCPGLELGHHPWKKKTYEEYIGRHGLDKLGKARWNLLLLDAIGETERLFNWDHLYLGGGNTKKIAVKLPKNVSIVSNEMGLLGGVALWQV